MKRAGWALMMVLATLIALYAAMVLAMPAWGPPFLQARRAEMPLAVILHLGGGLTALAVGAWQLHARLRSYNIAVHRWMGRTYAIAVLLGGLGALRLAGQAQHGLVTHVGFGLLAVLWLGATARGWLAIRARDEDRHRRWMIRSYALTLAAVTLRIYLPLAMGAGIPFADAYQVIAWLCWVPNLVVAEWVVLRPLVRQASPSSPTTADPSLI